MTRIQFRETHYEILSVPPNISLAPAPLKKAYHRALLIHHPDKLGSQPPNPKPRFTIDQITAAYTTLSTPHLRQEYERQLAASTSTIIGGVDEGKVLQSVDLDDFYYDEERERWTRACRCGAGEGFVITEEDLAADADGKGK
ncbi:Diphthamide biosynthesis protein 4 [Maublancomyces gigas]|uniref:Diphthamide biosynthesis protein 4 n=1 Tax=Discina gigas TaxID=1032678 RepID=A0ABR3GSS8_9PEZI